MTRQEIKRIEDQIRSNLQKITVRPDVARCDRIKKELDKAAQAAQ